MRILIIAFALCIVSCDSGPQTGQWYEHKGTKERIKVTSVGSGQQLKQLMVRVIADDNKITRSTRGYSMSSLVYDSSNANQDCIAFEKHHPGLLWWRWYIIPVKQLREDYSLVQ
jgi:hypothetical protein